MQPKLAENADDGLIKIRTKKSNVENIFLIYSKIDFVVSNFE